MIKETVLLTSKNQMTIKNTTDSVAGKSTSHINRERYKVYIIDFCVAGQESGSWGWPH